MSFLHPLLFNQYGGLSEPGMKSKDQLFLGSYMMYTSIPNDVPVQLKLLGHNVILIGSHYDEYVIDYFYIRCPPLPKSRFFSCANRLHRRCVSVGTERICS